MKPWTCPEAWAREVAAKMTPAELSAAITHLLMIATIDSPFNPLRHRNLPRSAEG